MASRKIQDDSSSPTKDSNGKIRNWGQTHLQNPRKYKREKKNGTGFQKGKGFRRKNNSRALEERENVKVKEDFTYVPGT